MPFYDYQCQKCEYRFELYLPIEKRNETQTCHVCGGDSKKCMTLGGIQDDHPVWLDDSIRCQIQDTDDPKTRPIETRSEYTRYLKDNGFVEDSSRL